MDGAPKNYNVSRDVTTPRSGTVCCPSTGTSYHHPVHQIRSLYVYSLRRYERRRKMQKLGWFGGLGITEGRRKHSYSIEHIRLPIPASILYRFRIIARFSSKVANFNPPHLSNFTMIFGTRKLVMGLSCGVICLILR